MPEIGYLNGQFGPLADLKVSIEDRGFQFGDGVYEVLAVYAGRPFLLDRHLSRLKISTQAIGISFDFESGALETVIREGLERSQFRDALIYIQITRGAAPRSHLIPGGLKPTLVLTIRPLPETPPALREHGASLMTTPDDRWGRCYIKAITLLPNVLARNEAVRRGFDDALFVAPDGDVRECTAANIFLVRGERIVTPPRDQSVLHGITQDFLHECAGGIGLGMFEERFEVGALREAEEVFMSSTSIEVLGVTRIDDCVFGTMPGPTTRRLFDEFRSRSRR